MKFKSISRLLHRFATARENKSAAFSQDFGKQLLKWHSGRRRLCAWISQSVSFAFILPTPLSSKASVIMITRHKWPLQCQVQSVKFVLNIWAIPNLRQKGEEDHMQTHNKPPRPKLQVCWRKTTRDKTITLIWAISSKATFTEELKKLTTVNWNPSMMMPTLRFPRRTNTATLWSKKLL